MSKAVTTTFGRAARQSVAQIAVFISLTHLKGCTCSPPHLTCFRPCWIVSSCGHMLCIRLDVTAPHLNRSYATGRSLLPNGASMNCSCPLKTSSTCAAPPFLAPGMHNVHNLLAGLQDVGDHRMHSILCNRSLSLHPIRATQHIASVASLAPIGGALSSCALRCRPCTAKLAGIDTVDHTLAYTTGT